MHRTPHNQVELISPPESVASPVDDSLEIPPFNKLGYLPPGIHTACFETVLERFATNPARKALFQRLEKFLLMVIDSHCYSHAYIGGDLMTVRSSPTEIDVVLQTQDSYGPHAFRAIEPIINMGLDSIRKKYSIRLHFWCPGFPEGINEFQDYFNCDTLHLNALTDPKKGIVGIQL